MQQPTTTQQGLQEDLFPPYSSLFTNSFIHCEDDLLLLPTPSYSSMFTHSSSFSQPTFQSLYNQSIYSSDPSFNASVSSSLYDQQVVPNQQESETRMMAEEDEDDDEDNGHDHDHIHKIHENVVCNDKIGQIPDVFNMGWNGEKKRKSKKVEGQPSKNLMAERRRRKRLNDRLSMLRSIVPKISKMDRTSILGDTIDYMKELQEKIHNLKEQDIDESKLVGSFKELKMNEGQVKNPPKFDVEREKMDTRIEICCSMKPGLTLSTLTTLEALGLDVQHCVMSCFNDFSLQASCSEGLEQESMISCEDMKQILFRNAGYGGRCL
ncbi:hypothetical protein OSB04_007639 [Centaurea solstitialis]|uniref:BHLH domain-containing protein n=1 Tax=Centaurea solstitialis TaxID=347529 RepID=A0AA38TLY8_9ASTR|nr:hypothetical protein OSB04_007639 [Centaurea solstitialis]